MLNICLCVSVCLFACVSECVCVFAWKGAVNVVKLAVLKSASVCVCVCVRERERRREGSEILVNQYCPNFFCTSLFSFFLLFIFHEIIIFFDFEHNKTFFSSCLEDFYFLPLCKNNNYTLEKIFSIWFKQKHFYLFF